MWRFGALHTHKGGKAPYIQQRRRYRRSSCVSSESTSPGRSSGFNRPGFFWQKSRKRMGSFRTRYAPHIGAFRDMPCAKHPALNTAIIGAVVAFYCRGGIKSPPVSSVVSAGALAGRPAPAFSLWYFGTRPLQPPGVFRGNALVRSGRSALHSTPSLSAR